MILDNNLIILNNGQSTHYHSQTNTNLVIDLTLCSADCHLDFQYSVLDRLYDSDHYPVELESTDYQVDFRGIASFNVDKADWELFNILTRVDENVNVDDIEEMTVYVTEIITAASNVAMLRKSGSMRRPPVPWWTAECERARRERLRAERAHKRNSSIGNKIR